MPTPLPALGDLFQGAEALRQAYERILPLENEHQVPIRILGWMMIHAPTDAGRAEIAHSINDCTDDAKVIETGTYYFQYFVKYFKTLANKPTPTPSTHPSRPTMDDLREIILGSIEQAPKSHSQAKDRALVRDGYRCQLTGDFDSKSYEKSPTVRAWADAIPGSDVNPTECHHILPQYISHNLSDNARMSNAATIWSIVEAYGGIPLDEVNGPGIHDLRNIMTLSANVHGLFDQLQIWLEPVEGLANTYSVGRRFPHFARGIPATITLGTDTGLPLPDRRYLALHAACAKVIHLSGAAEPIDLFLRDREEIKVLAQDGSSGNFLDNIFSGHNFTWSLRT